VTERTLFGIALYAVLAMAPVTWIALTRITAPYGRHTRRGWGPPISSKAGWVIMEAPASLAFAAVFAMGDHRVEPAPLALLVLWQAHYVHRAFIYPFRRRGGDKPMPLAIVGMGVCFNLINTYINARWISHFGDYSVDWLLGLRFLAGAALFAAGLATNRWSDQVLGRLRRPGETGYKIPQGGLYRWVSCPNYLGELAEWSGWALATWSLPGLAFALYTASNLVPRAISNHRWYRETFADYPRERKAVVPYLY
jgi:3-oxo-5-alpha-steroid 4-dehydrogenase 1